MVLVNNIYTTKVRILFEIYKKIPIYLVVLIKLYGFQLIIKNIALNWLGDKRTKLKIKMDKTIIINIIYYIIYYNI